MTREAKGIDLARGPWTVYSMAWHVYFLHGSEFPIIDLAFRAPLIATRVNACSVTDASA